MALVINHPKMEVKYKSPNFSCSLFLPQKKRRRRRRRTKKKTHLPAHTNSARLKIFKSILGLCIHRERRIRSETPRDKHIKLLVHWERKIIQRHTHTCERVSARVHVHVRVAQMETMIKKNEFEKDRTRLLHERRKKNHTHREGEWNIRLFIRKNSAQASEGGRELFTLWYHLCIHPPVRSFVRSCFTRQKSWRWGDSSTIHRHRWWTYR